MNLMYILLNLVLLQFMWTATCLENRFRFMMFQFYNLCLPSNTKIVFIGWCYYDSKQDVWTSGNSKVQGL